MKELDTEEQRRRAVAWAIALTADTALAPDHYEADLLEQYAQGAMSLSQVLELLDHRIQHLLYRSQATHPLSSAALTQLVEQAQAYNAAHQLTGLLCYSSNGHFVQVLEGPASAVHALYVKIQQDTRHGRIVTLSDQASPTRWFAEWAMALVETSPQDLFWVIGYLEAKAGNLAKPQLPITDPQLVQLLREFSNR